MNARLARQLIGREWRHHPWRHAVALLAVALGVALAYSVHLINTSALNEFSAAVRSANGEPDLSLRAQREGLDDAWLERLEDDPAIGAASPVLEVETIARTATGGRAAVRVLGIDALRVLPLAPALVPRPAAGEDRLARLDPGLVFINAAARRALGVTDGDPLALQSGTQWRPLRVAGAVAASGTPLLVMDIAGAQLAFGAVGRVSRIDLRLVAGADRAALVQRLALPAGVTAVAANDAEQRVSQLSRAYRVNLTVLALVALFVGAFLVYSVVALSVAQRTPQLALLGVLGLSAPERQRLVLAECAVLGTLGSALGLLAGAGMAALALRALAGDLGGGYFPGITPQMHLGAASALAFGALGLASAAVGGWWPSRQAARIAPAQALKGLGTLAAGRASARPGLALLAAGTALAFAPPLAGLPLAAYGSVAALLFGGVALIPAAVHAVLAAAPAGRRSPLWLLAVQRARFQRATATAAVSGVVASLALCTALTVMVASFRDGVAGWLDTVLPADLYVRTAGARGGEATVSLPSSLIEAAARVPGVRAASGLRVRPLLLAAGQPTVALVARPLGAEPARQLPLLAPALPASAGVPGVFVSEAMVALYDAAPGRMLMLPLAGREQPVYVQGVWRDYARQFGTIAMERDDYVALTGDTRVNDLAVWLQPGAGAADVQQRLRSLLPDPDALEFITTAELRRVSLGIFDRSFAVTYYLQAVAIAIGLVGIAASLSAQVLARRKEFGLLAHLGLTRRQVIAIVAGEGAAWLAAGVLLGLVLGLAVSVVLVKVVNPQSFHWSMPLVLPAGRLAVLAAAVLAAGVATAAFSARHAAGRPAVLSVKEDW